MGPFSGQCPRPELHRPIRPALVAPPRCPTARPSGPRSSGTSDPTRPRPRLPEVVARRPAPTHRRRTPLPRRYGPRPLRPPLRGQAPRGPPDRLRTPRPRPAHPALRTFPALRPYSAPRPRGPQWRRHPPSPFPRLRAPTGPPTPSSRPGRRARTGFRPSGLPVPPRCPPTLPRTAVRARRRRPCNAPRTSRPRPPAHRHPSFAAHPSSHPRRLPAVRGRSAGPLPRAPDRGSRPRQGTRPPPRALVRPPAPRPWGRCSAMSRLRVRGSVRPFRPLHTPRPRPRHRRPRSRGPRTSRHGTRRPAAHPSPRAPTPRAPPPPCRPPGDVPPSALPSRPRPYGRRRSPRSSPPVPAPGRRPPCRSSGPRPHRPHPSHRPHRPRRSHRPCRPRRSHRSHRSRGFPRSPRPR